MTTITTTIRILIADDHDIVRRGLRDLLEEHPGFEVCAEAGDGRDAVECAVQTQPNVAVLDYAMPGLNGLEATRRIRAMLPDTEVLVYTMHDSETLLRELLAAGARGYALKSDAARYLITAVEELARHRPFFTGRVSETLLRAYLQPDPPDFSLKAVAGSLTSREREIVQLLAEGRSNKDIAAALTISIKTVETHRAAIMRKLSLDSIADLVRYAVRNGLVEP